MRLAARSEPFQENWRSGFLLPLLDRGLFLRRQRLDVGHELRQQEQHLGLVLALVEQPRLLAELAGVK